MSMPLAMSYFCCLIMVGNTEPSEGGVNTTIVTLGISTALALGAPNITAFTMVTAKIMTLMTLEIMILEFMVLELMIFGRASMKLIHAFPVTRRLDPRVHCL